MTRLALLSLTCLVASWSPAFAQESELDRLRKKNQELEAQLKNAEADRKQAESKVLGLANELKQRTKRYGQELARIRKEKNAEIASLTTRNHEEVEGLLGELRQIDGRKSKLAGERDQALRELARAKRDSALEVARRESIIAKLRTSLAESQEEVAQQRARAANPKRCVSVALAATPLRQALAGLTKDTGVRHVVTPAALAGAKAKVVTLNEEHLTLEAVWAAIGAQTGLRPALEAGVVHFRGVTKTPTGLRYEDLRVGEGPAPKEGQILRVHYRGTFLDGKEFDSSLGKDPIEVELGARQVIPGFEEGLATMRVGGKRRLVLPPRLAYGAKGSGPIPPNATLVFEVELVSVK